MPHHDTPPKAASLLRRLAGMLYDTLLLAGVLAITLLFPHVLLGMFTQKVAHPVLLQAHFFLTLLLYFCWFWLHGGQTLAMKTWHIRLTGSDGRAVRPLQALLRYLLAWPSLLLGGLGLLWCLFDKDRQFLHDRLAGTRLIDTRLP
ncbi:RDD family protein [Azospira sp. I13]|uniref:RDD family protein n=1 Tax=Azospira sp. I13 TaxID=1765050 RepID=UPI000D4E267C|nr:RDD family protein [Azospira sp. I13]GBG01009.1 RDD family protein [Azospira sp. I13]